MIIVGTLTVVTAGLGLPGHIILGGSILNQVVSHSLVISNNLTITIVNSLLANETCASYQAQLRNDPQFMTNTISQGTSSSAGNSGYFCSNLSSGSDTTSNFLDYICDLGGTLRCMAYWYIFSLLHSELNQMLVWTKLSHFNLNIFTQGWCSIREVYI